MIKVDWAPKLCLINKRTNINEINNTKIDFNERLVTYDGPEHLSKEGKFKFLYSINTNIFRESVITSAYR